MDVSPRIPHCTACGEKPRSSEDLHEHDDQLFCPDCIDQVREDDKQPLFVLVPVTGASGEKLLAPKAR